MSEQKEIPFAQNKVTLIGNISAKNIELSDDGKRIMYSVAVGGGKDKDGREEKPNWYNCTYFMKDGEDKFANTLKELKEHGVGKQVKVLGNISHNKGKDKEGNDKWYANIKSYCVEPTSKFLLPKANIELTGVIHKQPMSADREIMNPETGEISNKTFLNLSIKTLEGKEADISKYHNIGTSNTENINFLKDLKPGQQISIKARLKPDGNVNLAKDSQALIGKDLSVKMRDNTNTKAKEVAQGR